MGWLGVFLIVIGSLLILFGWFLLPMEMQISKLNHTKPPMDPKRADRVSAAMTIIGGVALLVGVPLALLAAQELSQQAR